MKIPETTINEILSHIDIVDLISSYIPLKRAGKSFKALCPFHKEKTPSFIVSPEKQICYCFSCGAGGNVFSFLMKYEGINFYEAVKKLATQLNIEIPEDHEPKNNRANQLAAILSDSAQFYHKILLNKKHGKPGMDYFISRKIKPQTIDAFELGYAPDSWKELFLAATKKGYSIDDLISSGMVIEKNNKRDIYDRFRHRIMFPIHNLSGKVIGFGGRVLDDSLPKYVNSPENILFNKSKNLYGLDKARKAILDEKKVILVEGYMDFLRAHQEGICNVVATLGTALTTEHALLLKRFTNQIVMLYDSDAAGLAAAERAIDIFLEQGIIASVVVVEQAKDPDEYILKFGPEKFKQMIEQKSLDFFSFKIQNLKKQFSKDKDALNTAGLANEMFLTLAKIEDQILREGYLKKLAKTLNIRESVIQEQFQKKVKKRSNNAVLNKAQIAENSQKQAKMGPNKLLQAEQIVFQILFENKEFYDIIKTLIQKYKIDFSTRIFHDIWKIFEEQGYKEIKEIVTYFDSEENKKILSGLMLKPFTNLANAKIFLNDCLKVIIVYKLNLDIENLMKEQEQAILEHNQAKWKKITENIMELKKEKTKINHREADLL